jgi:quinol monooxygenase YgiN
MVIRIVRMHFRPEERETFLKIFDANKSAIRNFPGCRHLELLRDTNFPNNFTTLSHWDAVDDLNSYRNSELFDSVWIEVKKLFSARPEAFTLESFMHVEGTT